LSGLGECRSDGWSPANTFDLGKLFDALLLVLPDTTRVATHINNRGLPVVQRLAAGGFDMEGTIGWIARLSILPMVLLCCAPDSWVKGKAKCGIARCAFEIELTGTVEIAIPTGNPNIRF
jgi:hypothetical protein